jgi:hypothetical protein
MGKGLGVQAKKGFEKSKLGRPRRSDWLGYECLIHMSYGVSF